MQIPDSAFVAFALELETVTTGIHTYKLWSNLSGCLTTYFDTRLTAAITVNRTCREFKKTVRRYRQIHPGHRNLHRFHPHLRELAYAVQSQVNHAVHLDRL